jgi:PKD repeat protein
MHDRLAPSIHGRRWVGLALIAVLGACGGGGGGGDDGMPAPAGNASPLAAFSAPDSVVAGSAARFDAAASSDADGDALTYNWEFSGGNGARRGGGVQIAQAFATPGTYTVKLTVADGHGGIATATRTLEVTPGAASAGTVDTLIVVRDRSGAPLAGASIASAEGAATAVTAADGRATLATPRGIATVLRLSKAGYADQVKTLSLPAGAESGYLEATMAPREATLTLADAGAGGTLAGKDGASVVFAPGSIVDAAGAPVNGPVQVAITPIDVGADVHSFPGRFEGLRSDGTSAMILSYGTVEFSLSAGGQPVQLAPGRSATIEIPSYAGKHVDGSLVQAGDTTPLWSLDETTGAWVEEGSGTLVASAGSPSGFALRAEVTHFSWWNADRIFVAPNAPAARPKPKCMVDSNADGVLEDLTGTGHCWNAGTGPEQPESIFSASASRRHAQASAGAAPRIPAWAGDGWIPAAGGVVIPIPAGLDITFRAYAKNGTLFGTKVINLAGGVEEDVPILLEPVADNPGTLAVALPYDERLLLHAVGETDRFTFTGEAGTNYEVLVARNASSLLSGHARVIDANGAQLAAGGFGAGGFATVVSAGAGGTLSVEVAATAEAPGGYRVQIRKILPSSCGTPQTLALPQTIANVPIGAGATVCFDLPMQAGDTIRIGATLFGNTSGVLSLIDPDGVVAISRAYGFQVGAFGLETGVARAGTWQVQIRSTANTPQTLSNLGFTPVALDGTLDLGASASHSGLTPNIGRKYLVRPGAVAAVAYKLAVSGAAQSAAVAPMNAFIDAPVTTGRVLLHPAPLLPIVSVHAPSTSASFTLSVAAAESMALDADLGLTSPAFNDVRVWRIDGAAGSQWTMGSASTLNAFQMTLYGPDGARISPSGASLRMHTLTATGAQTLELRGAFNGVAPVTIRVNTAAPPEPIALGALTQRSVTLAIGEVRRFAFDVTRGQLLALRLATTTGLRAQAQIDGGSIHNGAIALSPPTQTTKLSGPLYVQQSAAAVLSVYSTGHEPGDASGALAFDIEAPTPMPAALGELLSLQLPPATLVDWRYDIAVEGRYLLCYAYTGAVDSGGNTRVRGTVWGPVARFSNYGGDLEGGGQGTTLETIGYLVAGANTLTLFSDLTAQAPAAARLVPLAPATALAVGASDGGAIAPCERRYHTFVATAGQAYTVKVTAGFAGSVRVRRAPPNGDLTVRTDPPFSSNNVGGTPLPLVSGVERVVTFTIPANSSGTYIVEIDGDLDASGSYSASLASP